MYMKTNKFSDFSYHNMLNYNHPTIQNDLKEILQNQLQWFYLNKKKFLILGGSYLETIYFTYTLMYLKKNNGIDLKITILTENASIFNTLYSSFVTDKNFNIMKYHKEKTIHCVGRVDYIIYFQRKLSKTNNHTTLKQGILEILNIVDLCKDKEPEDFLFYTSNDFIIDEKNISNKMEILFKSFSNESGIPYKIIKNPYTYGPGIELDENNKYLFDILNLIIKQSNITVSEETDSIKPYCYIKDTILGLLQVLLYGHNKETYYLSNEEECYSLNDITAYLREIYINNQLNIQLPPPSIFHNLPLSNLNKIKNIGWKATINLEEGIKRIISTLL